MKIIDRKTSEIIPYEKNPRINNNAVDKTAISIKEFGFQQPIVVDPAGVVIAGHTRLKAAIKLKLDTCPVIVAEGLTDAQIKAYRIADNRTGELATWDDELLLSEIKELDAMGFDVELTGFDLGKFDFGEKGGLTPDDEVSELLGDPAIKPGDLWLLGDHRVLCGDSTDVRQVERLMDGQKADMVFTDPPYNVNYEGGTKDKLKISNDDMSASDFYNFLLAAYKNYFLVLKDGSCIYVAHADTEGVNFRKAFTDSGLLLKQCLVWVKNSAPLSRQDYNWQHEPILYGWKPGGAHWFCKNFKLTTVIDDTVEIDFLERDILIDILKQIKLEQESTVVWEDRPTKSDLHPTMKPVRLIVRFILNSSKKNQIITDLFLGSGSTLIACEKTNRKCFGLELDPHYCQVILQRWSDYTGKDPVREDGTKYKDLR